MNYLCCCDWCVHPMILLQEHKKSISLGEVSQVSLNQNSKKILKMAELSTLSTMFLLQYGPEWSNILKTMLIIAHQIWLIIENNPNRLKYSQINGRAKNAKKRFVEVCRLALLSFLQRGGCHFYAFFSTNSKLDSNNLWTVSTMNLTLWLQWRII